MFQSSDKTKQEGKHGIKRGIKHALQTYSYLQLNLHVSRSYGPSVQSHPAKNYFLLSSQQVMVKGCFLFTANRVIIQLYHGKNKIHFDVIMMTSVLYQTNTHSWILQCQLTETTVCRQTCCSNFTHYPDSEPTTL